MEKQTYSYAASVKSNISDELINTYLIRPVAGLFVRICFPTSITPNHITIVSILVGFVAAFFYFDGSHNLVAGISITMKDILDSADGQLARAKKQYSRSGRFLDSIGDFLVNLFVFGAITIAVFHSSQSVIVILLGLIAFASLTLRVSYHVFYQTSYLHQQDSYGINRVTEEIRDEDLETDKLTLRLQQIFQTLYGWQDSLMLRIDQWCRVGVNAEYMHQWFSDANGLRLSGLIGLGTELFFLTVCSVLDRLELYLLVNVLGMNTIWIGTIAYRRVVVRNRLIAQHHRSH